MLEGLLGSTVGGIAGGALGQASDALSAPRRMLWQGLANALGKQAPESGADLLGGLGMDRDAALTQILGMLVEAAGDPLTYSGMGLGGLAGKTLGRGASAEGATAKALAARAAAEAVETLPATQMSRFDKMRAFIDPESLATGASRTYKNPDPVLAQKLEQMGLGAIDDQGGLSLQAGLKRGSMKTHADKAGSPGVPPPFAQGRSSRTASLVGTDVPLPDPSIVPTPEEMAMLRSSAQTHGADALKSIHSPADIFPEVAQARIGQLMPGALDSAGSAQSALEEALAKLAGHDDALNSLLDANTVAGISALAGGGAGLGSYLGSR